MKFLVDENLGRKFNNILRQAGHDAVLIADVMKGGDDLAVLAAAEKEGRILITNDLDFGKLVFEMRLPTYGVVLFRTLTRDPNELSELLKVLLDKDLRGKFIVLSEVRVRIRKL